MSAEMVEDIERILADDVHRAYLQQMLERNVYWWGERSEWNQMFQFEVLDRGLIRKWSAEHLAAIKMMGEKIAELGG